MGEIRFYEGPGCTQHYVGKLSSELTQSYQLNRPSSPIPADTRSCTLIQVSPGTRITLFGLPGSDDDDPCTEILVRAYVEEKCIPGFDKAISDDQVEVTLHQGKGVQREVDRIEVRSN